MKKLLLAALLAPLAFFGASGPARAVTVERIVAVIGERPILLSELRHRAIPARIRLLASARDNNIQAAEEKGLYGQLLERMIDDRLEEQAAEKARITASVEEIDRAVQTVGANAHLAPREVFAEVRRQGLSEQDFREEMKRQIIEGKLIELRVRPRVRVTEADARAAYQHWLLEVKQQHPVELRSLSMNVTPETFDARMARLEELLRKARAGADLCPMISQNSEDTTTRDTCGSAGPQPRAILAPEVQDALTTMKGLEFSNIMRLRYGGTDRIVFFQLMNDPRVPTYEEVKAEMSQRAVLEGLEHQRKLWLQEMRRGVYIDVRL